MTDQRRLAFLGAGQMAEAIIRGVMAAGLVTADRIIASDVIPARLDYLGRELGIETTNDNAVAVQFGDVIILSVKPQDIRTVLGGARDHMTANKLVVSIAAGVPLSVIEGELDSGVPAIRVMPNTPGRVGAGMAAIARGAMATAEHEAIALELFNAVGRAVALPESAIDAVTGLSGSGPAFVALFVEALADGGVRAGLARDVATALAIQTTLGTALMMRETGRHPALVKDMVSSPGGTTIAGVHALERGAFRGLVIDAVVAATERSKELGA